ncbi:hypothetical protein BC938DRAFT_471221 [Jimgerdemannia flammicorona]|uniref:DIS3-like exonuclease 1 n=1 Tax=Jimgerdemannia flammicorona TaxID=994334 RepID=A0A433QUP5_9FUNG|nr:hypothetical protein BC938DRAFT_471221 [Jimgerdemannia flammicorona]
MTATFSESSPNATYDVSLLMTMNRTENSFFRKTRKNAIVKQVREHYIRPDIPCLSELCSRTPPCHLRVVADSTLLSAEATHYLIPDLSVVSRYLEILEQEELSNLVIAQTIMASLEQHDRLRTYRRLRQVTSDPRRRSVFFYNEIFSETYVARLPNEGQKEREWRALCRVAAWYHHHLNGLLPILLLSENARFMSTPNFTQSDLTSQESSVGIVVCSVKQYLDRFWPGCAVLHELMGSLKDAVFEEDLTLERIRMTGKVGELLKKSNVGEPGYEEVLDLTELMRIVDLMIIWNLTHYKAADELEAGVKSGRYFQGVLRVSPSNRDQAYINGGSKIGGDILIIGNRHRNRAVHGDVVVVELLSENSWTVPANSMSYDLDMAKAAEEVGEQLARQSSEIRPTGRVLGVITRNWRSYVATVQEDAIDQGGNVLLTIPLDPIIPKIRVRYGDVRAISRQRIVVRIDSWPTTSQYPNGHYVRSLGPIHQLDTEISAILVEHEISVSQATQGFSEASLREMPEDTQQNPWKPDPTELKRRRDLRETHTVFSIDPPNCQDIDDALSVRDLNDGTVELGVHIADVSYFVKENTQTDLEARARGTTVYLADRRFDMLPAVLSERICSLRGNVDRFAVSIMWTLDQSYNILSTWFGRTVIRSACEMEYEQAQKLLNGAKSVEGLDQSLAQKLRQPILRLAEVLHVFKARRSAKGALELESSEVKFRMEEGQGINDINIL